MFPAALLTFALHGALLSWQMQKPQTLRPKPLPQRISVSLERLPPPLPPMKKIVQDMKALPAIAPVQHEALRPLIPQPKPQPKLIKPTPKLQPQPKPQPRPQPKPEPMKKIVHKIPVLPKIPRIKHLPARRLIRKPGKKISVVPQPLPKIAPVHRQPKKLLAVVQPPPVQKPVRKFVRQPVQKPVIRRVQPVPSRQQPVVRRTTSYRRTPQRVLQRTVRRTVTPIRRTRPTRTVRTVQPTRIQRSTPPVRTQRTAQTQRTAPASVNKGVVQEAAPLYKTNPPPKYPRMARRRGLQGVVTIEAKVNQSGKVDELRIFSSSGHTVLDKAALRAVRAWRFSPGTVGGRAQSMWVKVPVRFTLR